MSTNGATPKLHYGRLQPVEHSRREQAASIPQGTDIQDILKPVYWSHFIRDIRPGDIIEAFCEDGSWEASLRVMFVSSEGVKLQVRWKADYEVIEEREANELSETHYIKWVSPTRKFGVFRREGNMLVKDNFYPRLEAQAFLRTLR